jgi:hypothetical protein
MQASFRQIGARAQGHIGESQIIFLVLEPVAASIKVLRVVANARLGLRRPMHGDESLARRTTNVIGGEWDELGMAAPANQTCQHKAINGWGSVARV